jgi:hypothetical protein
MNSIRHLELQVRLMTLIERKKLSKEKGFASLDYCRIVGKYLLNDILGKLIKLAGNEGQIRAFVKSVRFPTKAHYEMIAIFQLIRKAFGKKRLRRTQ